MAGIHKLVRSSLFFFYVFFFPGGSAPRLPFSRPSASKMLAFGLQIYGPEQAQGLWAPSGPGPFFLIFPKTQFHFCRGPISSLCNPPYFLEAGFGLIRPRQYGGLNFQPGWQELLPVGDPQHSQTYVFGPFPPGAGGAQPGPGTGLSLGLVQAEPRAWSRFCPRARCHFLEI